MLNYGKDKEENKPNVKYGKDYLDQINFFTKISGLSSTKKLMNLYKGTVDSEKVETYSMLLSAKNSLKYTLSDYIKDTFENIYENRPKNLRESMNRLRPNGNWQWIPDDVVDSKELFRRHKTRNYLMSNYETMEWDFFKHGVRCDYENLKFQDKNRPVSAEGIINNLAVAYLYNIFDMVVTITSDDVIQDGQHRSISSFIAGMPIVYDINDNLTPRLVWSLNIGTTKMINEDNIIALAQNGVYNAKKYLEIAEYFGNMPIIINSDGSKLRKMTSDKGRYVFSKMYNCCLITGKTIDLSQFVQSICSKPANHDEEHEIIQRFESGKKVLQMMKDVSFYGEVDSNGDLIKIPDPNNSKKWIIKFDGFGTKFFVEESKVIPWYLTRIYMTNCFTDDEFKQLLICLRDANKIEYDGESYNYKLKLPKDEIECIKNIVRLYYSSVYSDVDVVNMNVYNFTHTYKQYWMKYGYKICKESKKKHDFDEKIDTVAKVNKNNKINEDSSLKMSINCQCDIVKS